MRVLALNGNHKIVRRLRGQGEGGTVGQEYNFRLIYYNSNV